MNEPLSPRAYGFTTAFGHPLGSEGWQLSVHDIVDAKPLALIESSTGAPCAALLARPAESSSLARHLGLREAALGHSFAVDGVWLAPGANARELLNC